MGNLPEAIVMYKRLSAIENGNRGGGIAARGGRRFGEVILGCAPDDLADRAILDFRQPLQAQYLWFWKKNLYLLHVSITSMERMVDQVKGASILARSHPEERAHRRGVGAARMIGWAIHSVGFPFVLYVPTPSKKRPSHRSRGTVVSPKLQDTNR